MKLADQIKYELIRWVESHAYDCVIPNFFVGGYEMDLFVLKKSGILVEYEIKITRSDFFNDFKKGTKHQRMIEKTCSANNFYFVVPEGLVSETEVPSYAGLIYFKSGRLWYVKGAERIHKNKYPGRELLHKLTFRCNNLTGKLRWQKYREQDLTKRIEQLKEALRKSDPKNISLFAPTPELTSK